MTASQTDPQIWIVVAILIAVVAFACAMSVITDRCQSIGPTVLCVLGVVLMAVIGGIVASEITMTPLPKQEREHTPGSMESEVPGGERTPVPRSAAPAAPIDI